MFDKHITNQFTRIVDDLVLASENDEEFTEVIKWVDTQSQKNGISFYEMVYNITDKQLTKKRAQHFLSEKMMDRREA
ncbi:MAG: hypothetical protein ACRD8W_00225 [Nitrososphaeraceae archaeon]